MTEEQANLLGDLSVFIGAVSRNAPMDSDDLLDDLFLVLEGRIKETKACEGMFEDTRSTRLRNWTSSMW